MAARPRKNSLTVVQREREGTPGAGDAAAKPTHRRDVSTCNTNLNVNWMDYSGAWSFYLLAVIMVWFCFFVLDGFRSGTAWTYTNMVHFLITFYLFHWKKGSPINADQGQFDDLTFWEQIDDGVHWTNTKKFLAGVPIGLCLLASNPYTGVAAEDGAVQLFNTALALLLLVAKVPEMHKVRLFGINRGIPTQ